MATLRPAVNDNDSFLSKIVKYIPAEIIAVYTAIAGVLKPPANAGPLQIDVERYFYVLLFLVIVTPIWTYIAVSGSKDIVVEPPSKKKRAIFHSVIAAIAIIIWVYAIGDILFKSLLCHCYFQPGSNSEEQSANLKAFNECLNNCKSYDSKLGAIILILFTGIIVPLLEWFILKSPIPPVAIKKAINS